MKFFKLNSFEKLQLYKKNVTFETSFYLKLTLFFIGLLGILCTLKNFFTTIRTTSESFAGLGRSILLFKFERFIDFSDYQVLTG